MTPTEEVPARHPHRQLITCKDAGEESSKARPKELLALAATFPADCGASSSPPPWLDADKIKRGQALFRRHFLGVFISNLVGLVCLLGVHSVLKVLVFTNRSSVRAATYRRYLSTMNHVKEWYSGDVFHPSSKAFRSIQQVRKMHSNAFTSAESAQVSVPSQADMVVTQWAFFGVLLIRGRQLGVYCSKEEEEGLVHFWRAVGYLLGIEDRFNLASGGLEEVRSRCEALREEMAAGLASPPPHFASMSEALLWGVHDVVPLVDPPAFTAFIHGLLGLPRPALDLTWWSTFILKLMEWNFGVLLHLPLLGDVLRGCQNGLLTLALNTCTSYPAVPAFCRQLEKSVFRALERVMALYYKVIHYSPVSFVYRR
ncbi:uncharacterized protein LOC127009423 [Eriocheir sinensis]|uniref:uncharacterized protein LOC127009423 n=1 Tax=Eriocheir sinensis TaxID=95602 RepID=UPI0021C8D7CE|nr:uncharacterized protein LOC127009423 [Eriocheir sinensis]